jgi:UDP-glucose:(heptosyl)LPS alpha-1,3-glucosyltransferase
MKIALVIPRFDPQVGGAERWTWDFAARLLRHGHEVHVVARRFATDLAPLSPPGRETGGEGLSRSLVRHPLPPPSPGTFWRLAFATAAESLLRRLDLDVIHDMGHGWYANVFMPHGGTRRGSFRQNLLLCPRGLRWAKRAAAAVLPRYRLFRAIERRQYEPDGSRLFVALSEMVRRDMTCYHALPPELIRIVHNGVDTDRFSPAHRPAQRDRLRRQWGVRDEVVFLLVAHNFKLKGVAPAIRAVGQFARERRDLRLVIVGNDRPGRYRRLARRLGCADLVHLAGRATDPVPIYAAADVYLHPTYYDPCSLVVLEALASGLPVITTSHNGAGELLTPGAEGFVVDDPGDVARLAGHMRELLDADLRKSCGRRARELAERHDLERNYRDVMAVYEEAIRRAPLAARRACA